MDKQTFTEGVRDAERSLYRVARSFLSRDADAADAVQEALLRAWAKRDTLRETAYFRTWLTRILINVCKRALRQGQRVTPVADVPETAPAYAGGASNAADGADGAGGADGAVRDALFSLDAKYRVPMVLFYLEGCSVRDIARMLTLPQGTVKNRLFRARALLRDQLQEEGNDA